MGKRRTFTTGPVILRILAFFPNVPITIYFFSPGFISAFSGRDGLERGDSISSGTFHFVGRSQYRDAL